MATIPSTSPPLKFSTLPGFNPSYTPREILEFGVFGGSYFYTLTSRDRLPTTLFKGLDENLWRNQFPDDSVNYFAVPTYQRRRQLINVSPEIRLLSKQGWFQWYCKFYYGTSRDRESIPRMQQCMQELKTFVHYINLYCAEADRPFSDLSVVAARPWRQQMLQFGYDPIVNPFDTGDVPINALTYNGEILTYNGEILTYGN
jgi:hypothetical protein